MPDYYYYHVTKQKNLDSIKRGGLIPFHGASDSGMANLHLIANRYNNDRAVIAMQMRNSSRDKIHLTQSWNAVCRYIEHMQTLTERSSEHDEYEESESPVILRCRVYSGLEDDPYDRDGFITRRTIPKTQIQVLLTSRCRARDIYAVTNNETILLNFGPSQTARIMLSPTCGSWLSINSWDPYYYSPAYPDLPPI